MVETWTEGTRMPRAAIGRLLRVALRGIAARRPATALTTAPSLAILVPHPDDETLACGGLIARRCAEGHPPHVAIVTDGSLGGRFARPEATTAGRRKELASALDRLGLPRDHILTLDFEDGTLHQNKDRLRKQLAAILEDLSPEAMVSTSAWDPSLDHATLGTVSRELAAQRGVDAYEVLVWGWYSLSEMARYITRDRPSPWLLAQWAATRSVDVSAYLELKRSALAEYQSQLHPSAANVGVPFRRDRADLVDEGGVVSRGLLDECLRSAEIYFPVPKKSGLMQV